MQALLLVAEHGGPTMFARTGVMRALNRHVECVFDPSRKDHHWGKQKLKRDQVRLDSLRRGDCRERKRTTCVDSAWLALERPQTARPPAGRATAQKKEAAN